MPEYIPLFYWSSIKFEGKPKENYGDLLSKYIVEKISGKEGKWVHPKKQPWYKWDKSNYLAIGSILAHATKDSIVWGSGIVDKKHAVAQANFRAVRGPQTQKFLENLGYNCPKVYGDPALLLPEYYKPEVKEKYKIGIIPHYVDYQPVNKLYKDHSNIKVIDLLTTDIEATTNEILSCEKIISSSLHGVIVSHAYRIPAVWVKFSNKVFGDDIKYQDYLESVGLDPYKPESIDSALTIKELEQIIKNNVCLPLPEKIKELQEGLMKNKPF